MKILGIALAIAIGLHGAGFAASAQKSFEPLDDAVNALVSAFRADDRKALAEVLGPLGRPVVSSGTTSQTAPHTSDSWRNTIALTGSKGAAGRSSSTSATTTIRSPFRSAPDGPRWFWDTDAGDEEILYRRIGRNELATIQVCLAYVDAQREYYAQVRTGSGILSTRSVWPAPRASVTASTGKRDRLRNRARSARS